MLVPCSRPGAGIGAVLKAQTVNLAIRLWGRDVAVNIVLYIQRIYF